MSKFRYVLEGVRSVLGWLTKKQASKKPQTEGITAARESFRITGMHCNSCAQLIEGTLSDAPGVRSASVDFASSRAVVEYDPGKTGPANLSKIVRDMGYGIKRDKQDA